VRDSKVITGMRSSPQCCYKNRSNQNGNTGG